MNILYIGPYRQNNIDGWTDCQILNNMLKNPKFNIRCCPIYMSDTAGTLSTISNNISEAENNRIDVFDVIIQRAKPEYLIHINKIPKNIAIPILNTSRFNDNIINNLSKFNSLLVDSKLNYNMLSIYSKLKNKIKTFDYTLLLDNIPKNKFNIGILNFTKKIYFIGDYKKNITNIHKICQSFIANTKSKEYSLLLFLTNLDSQSKTLLDNTIKQYYITHRINYTVNRILIIPIESNTESISIAHQTGDIYLDIQDDNSNSFNCKLAGALNKSIIQYHIEDFGLEFVHNNEPNLNGYTCLSLGAINNSIKNLILGRIDAAPPFKKQDINHLI